MLLANISSQDQTDLGEIGISSKAIGVCTHLKELKACKSGGLLLPSKAHSWTRSRVKAVRKVGIFSIHSQLMSRLTKSSSLSAEPSAGIQVGSFKFPSLSSALVRAGHLQ